MPSNQPPPLDWTVGAAAAIIREGRILLARRTYAGARWALPGGYVERGEHPTAALARELAE